MLTGPENMPVFGDNQLTSDEKRSIINYVQTIKEQADPGGAGIGRIGPVSEGLVIWVVGIGALLFGIFWMAEQGVSHDDDTPHAGRAPAARTSLARCTAARTTTTPPSSWRR